MNEDERKVRIRRLWLKVKLYVNLRSSVFKMQHDAEMREISELMNFHNSEDDESEEVHTDDQPF